MIDFKLPEELIAQEPAHPRDSARLLIYDRKTREITDTIFSNINDYLVKDSTLVVNNSKVENCRWLFEEGKVEVFVLEKLDNRNIRAVVRPGKKFKLGSKLLINDWLEFEAKAIDNEGIRTLKLSVDHDDKRLDEFEHVPLPPYIKQNDKLASEYQTVYADPLGSKAAPTAGLHFTYNLLKQIKAEHQIAEVTLHVGLGTFAPLNESNFKSGKLHEEMFSLDSENLARIQNANHITAVGTTSARTLESIGKEFQFVKGPTSHNGGVEGATDIFIQPGYEFKNVDSLITNFHLPGTSLLLMVEAFVGNKDELQKIYDHAIQQKYRFYSFGDAMLIL